MRFTVKHLLGTLVLACFITHSHLAQQLQIPDDAFRRALMARGVDTNGDNQLQVSEAEAVASLNLNNAGIQDPTGIEAFVHLRFLDISNNLLKSLDLSTLSLLDTLYCVTNRLSYLQLKGCTSLTFLNANNNPLSQLDLSHNLALKKLALEFCHLPQLDVSNNIALEELFCPGNSFTKLDLSHNKELLVLSCYSNSLSELVLEENKKLELLDCSNNSLNALDVTHTTSLTSLRCDFNSLTFLDLQTLLQLTHLTCNNNDLHSLDVRPATALNKLNCQGNLGLSIICVNDETYATEHFLKNPLAQWSESCLPSGLRSDNKMPIIAFYPNPSTTGFFQIRSGLDIQEMTIRNGSQQVIENRRPPFSSLDLHSQPKGMYFVQLSTPQGQLWQKLVIE